MNHHTFINQLEIELKNLPGEEAHVEMFPYRVKSSEALKLVDSYKLSGVLVLIYPTESSFDIILTERQTYDGNHSAQMSFPGGKIESGDSNTMDAAIRESFEEIGVASNEIRILGSLTQVYIPVSNYLVHPYVAILEAKPNFVRDEYEVKTIICFDLFEILKNENKIQTDVVAGNGMKLKNVPAFFIHEKIIWGATALMLNELRILLERFAR